MVELVKGMNSEQGLKDMSAQRRREGIALAEEIEVKYRREGKFFDEILRGE